MEKRLGRTFCTALFVLSLSLGWAFPQEIQNLSDKQVKERLRFIENALNTAQPRAKTWWYGWIAGYSCRATGLSRR